MSRITSKPPIALTTGFASKVLNNSEVLSNFPALKSIQNNLKDSTKRNNCCGKASDDPAYSQAVSLLKNMSDADLDKLKRIMGIDPNRKFVYFEREGKRYERIER